MVLTPEKYAIFSVDDYERPKYTGALNITANTPHIMTPTMVYDHKEDIAIFGQTVDVEKYLKKQVVAAIENLYIKLLLYSQTDTVIMTLDKIMTHLFASYGLVDDTKIAKEEQKISLMVWILNDPPVIVFNTVEKLVYLSKLGNVPKTQDQIFNIGVEIICKTRDFETGINEWFETP